MPVAAASNVNASTRDNASLQRQLAQVRSMRSGRSLYLASCRRVNEHELACSQQGVVDGARRVRACQGKVRVVGAVGMALS